MKKVLKVLVLALSLGIIYTAVETYCYEVKKVEAINAHASFLANKENIEYVSLEAERKARAEADRKAAEKEKIRQEQEKQKQEEEKKKAQDLKQQENTAINEQVVASNKNVKLEVKTISQLPEYKNGCEATSVTMLLNYAGVLVDKNTIVSKMKKDSTEVKYDGRGNIVNWGNPKVGFVGDVTGRGPGYSIDPVALTSVINEYLPGRALDLTGCEFYKLEDILYSGRPIVVWVNKSFETPQVSYTWTSSQGQVSAFKNQHAVILTGYDENSFYYNDPLAKEVKSSISKEVFKKVWTGMGSKALSYYK